MATSSAQQIKNSKVARRPVLIPKSAELKITDMLIEASGSNGKLNLQNHAMVNLDLSDDADGKLLKVSPVNASKEARALAGTYRALVSNMLKGVTDGFQKTLELKGVGYRAKLAGNALELTLGFSHPISYDIPADIKLELPNQTTIIVSGADKQKVGQVSAEIRAFRPPENYKGKGVRYQDEYIIIKETKK